MAVIEFHGLLSVTQQVLSPIHAIFVLVKNQHQSLVAIIRLFIYVQRLDVVLPHFLLEQQPRQGSRNTSSNEAPFVEDPPLDMSDENILSKPALHPDNWELVENFYNTLYSFAQEECGRCQEQWFKMKLRDGVCDRCRRVDRGQMIFLYSPGNNMDPGDVPAFLPELTQTEEMLIARVHVHMEIRQIRGQQYIDIKAILLTSFGTRNANPRMSQPPVPTRFKGQARTYAWLSYLIAHHPGYRDIQIDHANLIKLPEDGSVIDQILSEDVAIESIENHTDIPVEADYPETVAVPDMTTTLPLLSLALPTLFPQGKADYSIPWERTVKFHDYTQHLMEYKDGRFARHPRFQFIVFNTMMRAAFEEDSEESNSVVNSITRMSNTIQGTRPYWASKRSDLIAYNQNLGASYLFFTSTPADYQWGDLQRQFPNYERWKDGNAIERRVIARENVVNNPHICAYWFWLRLKTFFNEILQKSYNLKDYYTRYEWSISNTNFQSVNRMV
ncbi:hypothetical protein TSTA_106280 [Talaromyces stipitatus ATCC 10500]|uniref:Uncharacterized protein n=1 Tax=Talaromyces stipitatus (strain ATCC 10500 / CBS 375.48 / QM 6759 / NRRL 1006) TaxID=441959 RepID=B8MPI0_TALSN|nr:uncharacterized protein TSTA_106280 [Talaromyces stipitatus ATCC 10500]EED14419.1 hypothetical protein TSTA_106280 [Talaromyces stipitatus ATCC 10500]